MFRQNSLHSLNGRSPPAIAKDEIVRPENALVRPENAIVRPENALVRPENALIRPDNALVPHKPDVDERPPQNVISERPSVNDLNQIERICITISIPNDGIYRIWELLAVLFSKSDSVNYILFVIKLELMQYILVYLFTGQILCINKTRR